MNIFNPISSTFYIKVFYLALNSVSQLGKCQHKNHIYPSNKCFFKIKWPMPDLNC